jgi:hypothetical protein
MKKKFIEIFAFLFTKFMRAQIKKTIRIEGGLGSQIIGILTYETRKSLGLPARADVSYFTNQVKKEEKKSVSIWEWELSEYGFSFESFCKESKFYDKYLSVIFSKSSTKNAHDFEIFSQIPWQDFAHRLPLSKGVNSFLEKNGLSTKDDFAVIHIRRGDYLRVASRVLSLEDSINGFNRTSISPNLPIFITCDDYLSAKDLEYCKQHLATETLVIVDPSLDLHVVHGLMRAASVLVTSNSTFSFTAAKLTVRESPLILSPTTFVGEIENPINNTFRSSSTWMLLDVS